MRGLVAWELDAQGRVLLNISNSACRTSMFPVSPDSLLLTMLDRDIALYLSMGWPVAVCWPVARLSQLAFRATAEKGQRRCWWSDEWRLEEEGVGALLTRRRMHAMIATALTGV